jgi:hypothetical protein
MEAIRYARLESGLAYKRKKPETYEVPSGRSNYRDDA